MNTNPIKSVTEEEQEKIEAYLLHTMNAEERAAFELQLSVDEDLQEKTESVRLLISGIRDVQAKKLFRSFQDRLSKEKTNKPKVISIRRWLVAASLFAVALVGAWFIYGPDKSTRLYENYYVQDTGLIGTMSAENDQYQFEYGMVEYKTKQYDIALHAWQPLLDQQPENDTLQYFVAMAHLAKKQYSSARPLLENITNQPESVFYQDASWYYGLLLVKETKWPEAVPYIKRSNHPKKEKLLESIQEK